MPPAQLIPTTQMAIDSTTWFCGIDWDWIESHCDEAIPCPNGDAVDCPANHACFASTPCTLAPQQAPSSDPSGAPSCGPTPPPTRAPWSEETLKDFLNAVSGTAAGDSAADNLGDGAAAQNGGDGGAAGSGGGANFGFDDQQLSSSLEGGSAAAISDDKNGGVLATEVNEKLENYNSLQYHFFCGISWTHADETCDVFCPSGDKSDCPDGAECYANTRCDGRDTPPPTVSPAPSAEGQTAASAANAIPKGEICSLCEGLTLETSKSVAFQTQTTTCGNINEMLTEEDILADSATCTGVHGMYRKKCCYDECQLCQSPIDGTFMDLRGEHLVQQGGYEANCQEISTILSTTAAKVDTFCTDAQTQLGPECCYEQCSMCGEASEGMSTEWYATVSFQGLTTTCLGLDYMLRAEQVSEGSDRCSALQGQYMDRCCFHPSGDEVSKEVISSDSCQLCKSDDVLYDLIPGKSITVTQSTGSKTMTCTGMSDAIAKVGTADQECNEGKRAFFFSCCDYAVIDPVVVAQDDNVIGSSSSTAGGMSSNVPPAGELPNPSSSPPINLMTTPPTTTNSPTTETRSPTTTNSPSSSLGTPKSPISKDSKQDSKGADSKGAGQPDYWGQEAPGEFSWDRDWTPGNGSSQAVTSWLGLVISVLGAILFV